MKTLQKTKHGRKLLRQEKMLLDVTESLCEAMNKHHVTTTELARRLGRSKAYVTKVLNGQFDLKIRQVADIHSAIEGDY